MPRGTGGRGLILGVQAQALGRGCRGALTVFLDLFELAVDVASAIRGLWGFTNMNDAPIFFLWHPALQTCHLQLVQGSCSLVSRRGVLLPCLYVLSNNCNWISTPDFLAAAQCAYGGFLL